MIPFFYLIVFLAIEVLDVLLPYSAISKSTYSYCVYYLFNGFVFLGLLAFSSIPFQLSERIYISRWPAKISAFCFIVSVAGVALIYLDRVYIQGVDYSQGVSVAREAWRAQANLRQGVSSIYSVVGNLFFPFVFVSLIFSVVYGDYYKSSLWLFILSLILVLIFSLVTGGREAALIFVAVMVSSVAFRLYVGFAWLPKRLLISAVLVFALVFSYSVYISLSRAEGSGFEVDDYAYLTANKLMGVFDPGLLSFIPDSLAPVALYFVHVKWVFIDIVSCSSCVGISTFRLAHALVAGYAGGALGIGNDVLSVGYYPNWISLNGSLYYDLGWIGVIFITLPYFFSKVFIGALIAVPERRFNYFAVISYVFFISLVIFSPFAFLLEIVQYLYFVFPLMIVLSLCFICSLYDKYRKVSEDQ